MRRLCALVLLTLFGCSSPHGAAEQPLQTLQCSNGDTPIYTSRFAAQSGGSGVATAEDAAAGKTNSDPPSGGVSGSPTSESKGGAVDDVAPGEGTSETPVAPSPASPPSPSIPAGPLTAMVATCGQSGCPAGQVAVEAPPTLGNTPAATGGATTGAVGEGFISPPATGSAIDSSTVDSSTVGSTTVSTTTVGSAEPSPPSDPVHPTPAAPSIPSVPLLCVDPPPSCPAGQSPQYTARSGWECTDCSYVVTYGGIYGNYRRCVSAPQIKCAAGQVPTWVFEDDQWECKDTCDNGEYDQHMLNGLLVCVPC